MVPRQAYRRTREATRARCIDTPGDPPQTCAGGTVPHAARRFARRNRRFRIGRHAHRARLLILRPDPPAHPPAATESSCRQDACMSLPEVAPSPAGHARSPTLSVVSPVYGCADCLSELCSRIATAAAELSVDYEIVLVCDASPDAAWPRMQELSAADARIKGLRFSRNFGQHSAIAAGLAHARGRWIVVLDCDLQDPPAAIPALYAKAQQGFDVVVAERKRRKDGFFKRLSSRLFYRTLAWLTGDAYNPETANFGIYSRRVVDTVLTLQESGRFFPLLVRWSGFPYATLAVEHGSRASGRSGYTLVAAIRLALDVITSYSDQPLRLVAKLGLLFGLLSFVFVGLGLWKYFAGDIAVAGYTSIIASIWLVGGTILLSLGVVGLYIGRIFNEVKRRPHYVVAERLNLDASPTLDGRGGR
jgi:polyisoprenyl-phosphate glycosyltransferase